MSSHPNDYRFRHRLSTVALAVVIIAMGITRVQAFEISTDNPDLKLTWDNTFKYSNAFRVRGASQSIVGGDNYDTTSANYFPNTDDGSNNFGRGLISNRFDLFSEFDVAYRGFGARASGAAWYDTVYNTHNDNTSPSTANPISVPYDQFTSATRNLHGRKGELLDAFVFGGFKLGTADFNFRLGKHTVLYGESLMLGGNGIAAAQAPIDVVKAASVPNAQFKEFMMPINQVSGLLQLSPDLTIGAYYQLDWKPDRLPGSGSYFSFMDALGDGGERLIVGSSPAGNVSFHREGDLKAKRSGQGGMQIRWHAGETDYGLYAVRWHSRSPAGLYIHPFAAPVVSGTGVQAGTYQWVFHEGIRAFGGSAARTFGTVNLSAEVSFRSNVPLDSDAQADLGGGNNSSNPLYAVGKSAHAQVSWIAAANDTFIAREADFVGELAWNRLLSITKNPAAITPDTTRDAANVRMVFEPKYRQVIDGVDLSVPVGLGWGFIGNSAMVGSFAGKKTGDISIGLNGAFVDVWRFGLNYTHYIGKATPFVSGGHHVYNQFYADRDYVSFNVRRSF